MNGLWQSSSVTSQLWKIEKVELYERILKQYKKRKQRHKELTYNVIDMAYKEYKQIKTLQNIPKSSKTNTTTMQSKLNHYETTTTKYYEAPKRVLLKMAKQDLAEDRTKKENENTLNLW